MLIDLKRRTRTRVSLRINIAYDKPFNDTDSPCASAEQARSADEFTKEFRTMINRSVEQSRRVSPRHRLLRRYVTRFVTCLLRGRIPRPREPLFPHPIKSIVLTSKAAGVAEAITVKNSPRCARDRCVGESIDKTLCIYGYESRRARCAIYLRLSMYVCLARYRAAIISAHGRERMHSLRGPRMQL